MYLNTYQFTDKEHREEYNGSNLYSHYNFKTGQRVHWSDLFIHEQGRARVWSHRKCDANINSD